MSDLNHNNYAYLYGNTFVDVCEEASRHYRPPYRPIDLMRPPLGQHIYGGHCCCNDYPVRPDPYHKCPADDCTPYDPNCKCGNHGTAPDDTSINGDHPQSHYNYDKSPILDKGECYELIMP